MDYFNSRYTLKELIEIYADLGGVAPAGAGRCTLARLLEDEFASHG